MSARGESIPSCVPGCAEAFCAGYCYLSSPRTRPSAWLGLAPRQVTTGRQAELACPRRRRATRHRTDAPQQWRPVQSFCGASIRRRCLSCGRRRTSGSRVSWLSMVHKRFHAKMRGALSWINGGAAAFDSDTLAAWAHLLCCPCCQICGLPGINCVGMIA